MKTPSITLILACALLSCGERKPTRGADSSQAPATSQALLAVLEATPPGTAQAIHQARITAQPGDVVTLRGQVMGNANPFVDGRAAFILGDTSVLTACNEVPGDNCSTPWDACCDTAEEKRRGLATVQVVNDQGRVLKEEIEGLKGIEKLARLTVSGIVAESSTDEHFVINATSIAVVDNETP